jgi:hypothetical protein
VPHHEDIRTEEEEGNTFMEIAFEKQDNQNSG